MKTSILLAQAEHAKEAVVELPIPSIMFGVITLSILVLLMFITMSWKGISHRH